MTLSFEELRSEGVKKLRSEGVKELRSEGVKPIPFYYKELSLRVTIQRTH